MKKQLGLFILIFGALSLTGFGCIKQSAAPNSIGGVWKTSDAGIEWTEKNVFPKAEGVSSISPVDVVDIVSDPSDPDAFYAITMNHGLLYSYDNAETWMLPEEETLRSGRVRDVAVDPSNKCVIYIARGTNIYKSIDCNRNYDKEAFVETRGKRIFEVEVDWFNPDVVWIATEDGDIIRSADAGKSWFNMGSAAAVITDLMIDNSDSRIVMATTEGNAIFRTTDSGVTWTELKDDFKEWKGANNGFDIVQTADGRTMYYSSSYGILRSRDHGATWEPLNLLTPSGSGGVRIFSLEVDPNDGNVLYYGTRNTIYSSRDGGVTWVTQKLPTTRAATHLIVDPNSTGTLFMGVTALEEGQE